MPVDALRRPVERPRHLLLRSAIAVAVAVAGSTGSPARASGESVSWGGTTAIGEQQAAAAINSSALSVAGGALDSGYLEFAVTSAESSDELSLATVATPVTTAGAVSVVGDAVFLGNGSTADNIGSVDEVRDGTAGATLRINFVNAFPNASFESDAAGSSSITGWTEYPQQIRLGTDSIEGVQTVDTGTYPNLCASVGDDDDGKYLASSFSSTSFTIAVDGVQASSGSRSLRLSMSASGNGGGWYLRGPAIASSSFQAAAGDVLSFDWRSIASSDRFAAFGYLLNVGTSTQTEILDSVAPNGNMTTNWTTVAVPISTSGTYRFVFVSGAYNGDCGSQGSAALYIDNVVVVGNKATAAVATEVARLVRYANTSDAPPASRTVTATARYANGTTSEAASTTVTIAAENDPPAITGDGGTTTIDRTVVEQDADSVENPIADVTGTIAASDPDGVGEVLTFGIDGGTSAGGEVSRTGTYGTLVVTAATGAYRFEPDMDAIKPLNTGDDPTETFTVTVSDGTLSATGTLRFTIDSITDTEPTVSATGVSGIGMTTAALSAEVTTSATAVTARGFVIGTSDTPRLGGAGVVQVTAGTGTGTFTGTVTGRTDDTTYYVRAYATNAGGTGYGATQVFTTAANAIATTAGTVRWFEGPTVVDAGITVEGADLGGATVSIDNNRSGDVLACPDTTATGITCSYGAATGVLTLSGTATAATYQEVLRGVTFAATNTGTDVTSRTVTFNLGGALTFDPTTGHYYEVIQVSSSGAAYTGGAQDADGVQGDLGSGSGISWEEARCRAKYSNARFGGTLMEGSTRVANRTTQAADGCVPLDGTSPLAARTLNGLEGHLANITSLSEHQFLRTKLTGTGWIGGADVDDEGTWVWMDGPEAGEVFWIQGTTTTRRGTNTIGSATPFNYWSDGEPNDAGGEHWAEFGFGNAGVGSSWNDCRNGCGPRTRYVVEYSASGGVVPPVLSATRTMSPLPAQTITFAPAAELVYGDPDLTLAASSDSGLAVGLAVTTGDGTVCTLTGATLTWVAPGSCTITATQAGNDTDGGVQPAPDVVRTVTMARRPLPITGLTATPRTYDGTTAVVVTGTPAFDVADLVVGDEGGVTAGGSPAATLPSPAAGDGRSATVSGVTLSGARAFAYEPTGTVSVDIARREVRLDGSFTVADRAYDGTTTVTAATQALTLRAGDVLAGDVGSLGLGTVTFAADSAVAGTRTATPATAVLTGARAADYVAVMTDAPTASYSITAVPLTIASGTFTVADKVYDGTDAATITADTLVLSGFIAGDSAADLTWTPTGRFAVTTAGTGRTVELAGGAVFGGAKGGGYTLDVTGAPTATAAITPRPVTVSGASAAGRPYDGTTTVVIAGATLANTVAGDVVSLANANSGVAASPNAGTQSVSTTMTITGTDAANYRLAGQPSLSITITPLPVSVTMAALPARPYDGTTALVLPPSAFAVSGVLGGESIAVSGTGRLSSRAAGTRTVTLDPPTFTAGAGTVLTNYALPGSISGSVTITPLPLRVVGATVTTRAWDGTLAATVTGATLEGVRSGDSVSLTSATTGTFAVSAPGTHAVRFSPTLVGVDAINYSLVVPPLTGTITRAPATLRITGGLSQIADGTPRGVRAAVSPAGVGRVVITYSGGSAPSEPGEHTVTVTLESSTHEAPPLTATMTVAPLEVLIPAARTVAGPEDGGDEVREELLARIAVRPDGSLALPLIGPVLEEDGSAPDLRPNDRRVLDDGVPVDARVVVIEDQKVRIEDGDGTFALELEAAIGVGEERVPLPVDSDGTLLLDPEGTVDVAGSGFLPGSTAEVWMFSTATFLGTAVVDADGTFAGAFPVDTSLEPGDHTIQLNGIGADERVRSASLGVRIDDPEDPARERIAFASDAGRGDGTGVASGPAWLLLLAALVGAGVMRWWLVGRRRDDEDEDPEGSERIVPAAARRTR